MPIQKVKEVKGITPILQSVLVKQISTILEALNGDANFDAWLALRALVLASPPKVLKICGEDVEKLESEIFRIGGIRGIDVVFTKGQNKRRILYLCRQRVRPLFRKVMDALYEGKYLENYYETARGREIGY